MQSLKTFRLQSQLCRIKTATVNSISRNSCIRHRHRRRTYVVNVEGPETQKINIPEGVELNEPHRIIRNDEQSDDHRSLGTALSLFTTNPFSPGSPLFHPDGTHIFQKLQAFVRAQYLYLAFKKL